MSKLFRRFNKWLINFIPNFFESKLDKLGRTQIKLLTFLMLVSSIPLIITPLEVWQQGVVAAMMIAIGFLIIELDKKTTQTENSEYLHLFIAWLSIVTTLRYLYYRTNYTLNFNSWINSIFCILLYLAELYAIITLLLAYFQTIKIQERQPVNLSNIPQENWFKVDIYIPTYNEPVDIVRKTALASLAMDYPADKKRVYILDDGRAEKLKSRREELQLMCEELGCTHLTRENNDHNKAGNINHAFQQTDGDLVLILDCDHIPSRNFLMETVGFFFDSKVSFVQTPHWFYNPDPFERNLLTGSKIPVANELFYKVLQKGNDFWNAAFFCGSAALLRKEYVMPIGGIAVETVTEDCHTALRLHSLGYKSIYYDKIMVAGLAPEKFSDYVGQQMRWARGMAQILRLENPLFNPKLKLTIPQRICYFSATSHFFYGFPRLMYAIAPTLFLLFGINPIQGFGLETLVYALPHILLSLNANYITYKKVRYSFWNEIFEFALAFRTGLVTIIAIINPKLGNFNVTNKQGIIKKRTFDWQSSKELLIVGTLVLLSLIAVPFWLILFPEAHEAVLVNALWSVFNLTLISAAILVAFEQPQVRKSPRLYRELTAIIYSHNQKLTGKTKEISENGAQIIVDSWQNLPEEVELELVGDYGAKAFLTARIVRGVPINESQTALMVEFINPTRSQLDALTIIIYSDVKEWYSQKRTELDDPLGSLKFLATGIMRVFRDAQPATPMIIRKQLQAPAQLYWESHSSMALVTEIGRQSLRLELDINSLSNWEKLQKLKPVVGLLLTPDLTSSLSIRLLAIVQTVKPLLDDKISIELIFPEALKHRQEHKVKELLRLL